MENRLLQYLPISVHIILFPGITSEWTFLSGITWDPWTLEIWGQNKKALDTNQHRSRPVLGCRTTEGEEHSSPRHKRI